MKAPHNKFLWDVMAWTWSKMLGKHSSKRAILVSAYVWSRVHRHHTPRGAQQHPAHQPGREMGCYRKGFFIIFLNVIPTNFPALQVWKCYGTISTFSWCMFFFFLILKTNCIFLIELVIKNKSSWPFIEPCFPRNTKKSEVKKDLWPKQLLTGFYFTTIIKVSGPNASVENFMLFAQNDSEVKRSLNEHVGHML